MMTMTERQQEEAQDDLMEWGAANPDTHPSERLAAADRAAMQTEGA